MVVNRPYRRKWKTAGGEPREAWVVEWFDENDQRQRDQFPTKRKANDRYDELIKRAGEREANAGLEAGATVTEAGEAWIRSVKSNGRPNGNHAVEPTTVKKYEEHLEKYIKPRIGSRVIDRFTPRDARAYQERIANDADISDGMRKKIFDSTKMLFKAAVGVYIPATPFAELQMAKRRSKRAKAQADVMRLLGQPSEDGKRAPTLEETRILLAKLDELAKAEADMGHKRRFWLQWATAFNVLVFAGGRISEILGLPWRYLQTDLGLAVIAQRADQLGNIGAPKSAAGARLVTLPQHVCDRLEKWRRHCPVGELGLVFPNGAGNVESQSNLRARVLLPLFRACKLIVTLPDGREVLPFTMHDYRGLHNELERTLGVSLSDRMEQHGWSSEKMADDTYAKQLLDPEVAAVRRQNAEALSKLVLGRGPAPAAAAE